MAILSAGERQRLGSVRPELLVLLLALKDAALEQLGVTIVVAADGGLRTTARQAQLYQAALDAGGGTETGYAVAPPGRSRHEYGAAFDVDIVDGGSSVDGSGAGTDEDYQQLADVAQRLGLVAGYYFDARGVGKHDADHFQLNETFQQSVDAWAALARSRTVRNVAIGVGALVAGWFLVGH